MLNIHELIGQVVCSGCVNIIDSTTGTQYKYEIKDLRVLKALIGINEDDIRCEDCKLISYLENMANVYDTVTRVDILTENRDLNLNTHKPVDSATTNLESPAKCTGYIPRINDSFIDDSDNSDNVQSKQQQEFLNKLKNDSRLLLDQRAYMIIKRWFNGYDNIYFSDFVEFL